MKDENCIFCKLANGDIPTATVYEDEYLRAIMDAAPANKGTLLSYLSHTLRISMSLKMNM